MENWRENFSVISKLKVTGNGRDALARRLRFERLFGAANFHPPGISPRALLCVRKISAPPFESHRTGFGATTLDWEIGIRKRIEILARRAFRPVREVVPAEAESVIFEDKAEMLACLARDWLSANITGCWWWRGLFPKLFLSETIVEIWLERAEFAPAALAILSKKGAALDFVGKLEPAEAAAMLHEIARIFGLDKLSAALGEKRRAVSKPVIETPPEIGRREKKNRAALAESDAFFARLIPESIAADLIFERRVLLETALLLARNPRLSRAPEFAERVTLFREKNELENILTGRKSIPVDSKKKEPREGKPQIRKQTKSRRQDKKEPLKDKSPGKKHERLFAAAPEAERRENPTQKAPPGLSKTTEKSDELSFEAEKIKAATPPAKIEFEYFQADHSETNAENTEQITKAREAQLFIKSPTSEKVFENFFEPVEAEIELSFQTRFGGLFYLLNLGVFLGLYRDFTESLNEEIDLNIWDFVALLGLEFLGDEIKRDAVWDFLKRAATRESDGDFGRKFDQTSDWRVPPAWLATFSGDRTWIWASRGQRLVVRHPEGFNVTDVKPRGHTETQLAGELEIYRQNFARIARADGKNQLLPESKSWLKNLAEYLEKRLFQALNRQTPDDLNAILFEQRARVTVSATHLEITFALADLPIEVRLAGIDRDPGWIPAAGKFVYFHFA